MLQPQLFRYEFLLVYHSSLFVCFFLFLLVFGKHFLHLLNLCFHSFSKILDKSSLSLFREFFFWKVPYLLFISLLFWSFVLSLPLGHTILHFHLDYFLRCGFHSGSCRIVILLASSVCPLVDEVKRLV